MKINSTLNISKTVVLLFFTLASGGCTLLAELEIEKDMHVFEADLGMFRNCLKNRGGSCQGSDTTALPHSSQHGASGKVVPAHPGSSPELADSVASLPAGHPAKKAHAVLNHSVVKQASALHNHLRGHATGTVEGVSIDKGQGEYGGPQSRVNMGMKVNHLEDFHESLSRSTGSTAWEALHNHCQSLRTRQDLANHEQLEADCRHIAFIRGYLEAYFRDGEFLELNVNLSGVEQPLNNAITQLQSLEKQITADEALLHTKTDQDGENISIAVQQVVVELDKLLGQLTGEIKRHIGQVGNSLVRDIAAFRDNTSAKSSALALAASSNATQDIQSLGSEISKDLAHTNKLLVSLQTEISQVEGKLNKIFGPGASPRNLLKVSNIGYLSRDTTFQARLPTLDVTVEPDTLHYVKLSDVNTGQILTSGSSLNRLGVGSDHSGVGTGASMGAEVVRIFFEALFDAHEGLPAIASAGTTTKATGLTLGEYSLPQFNSPMGYVDGQDFSHMTTLNTRLAAKVRIITGRVVEGIGPLSLNNPSLENLIVEIITTSVRKATEKASWCWYACNLNVASQTLEKDTQSAVANTLSEAKNKLQSSANQERGKLRTWGHQEAEHVKLKLHLN